jgi:hypothetical protein
MSTCSERYGWLWDGCRLRFVYVHGGCSSAHAGALLLSRICGLGHHVSVKLPSRRRIVPQPGSAFAGFRFPAEVIVLAIRWYLRYGLSYRDVEELLVERGVEVDHVTVYRWVQRFTPLLADAARFCRHSSGDRWFVDET